MKRIPVILFSLLVSLTAFGQSESVPRFAKYPVANTGCSLYLPGEPGRFELSLSQDSSEVYTCEVPYGEFFFAAIVVKFIPGTSLELETVEDKELLMESYLDFLQNQFSILESAGYGWGHTMESAPKATGVIDFWAGDDDTVYAIKSWCDGKFLSVLLLYGPKEYPYSSAQDMFLNGFRFPEP